MLNIELSNNVTNSAVIDLILIIGVLTLTVKLFNDFAKSPLYKSFCKRWWPAFICILKKQTDAIDLSKPVKPKPIGKFSAWVFMITFSSIAMWFFATGMARGLLMIGQGFQEGQHIKSSIGILFFCGLLFIGYVYKGSAYLVARENEINLQPWKSFFLKG